MNNKKSIITLLLLILFLWANEDLNIERPLNLDLPLLDNNHIDPQLSVQHYLESEKGLRFFQVLESFSLSKSQIKIRFPLKQKCVIGLKQTVFYIRETHDVLKDTPTRNGDVVYFFYYKRVSSIQKVLNSLFKT